MTLQMIIAAMLSLTPWHGDKHETPAQRRELYAPVAAAIAGAARGDRDVIAALVALGYHETRYARYVVEGQCADGPPGIRCDYSRRYKRPMARGPWQLHGHCVAAWRAPDGSVVSLEAGARCAASLLRAGRARCGNWSEAFGTLHRGRCVARPEREATRRLVLRQLGSAPST